MNGLFDYIFKSMSNTEYTLKKSMQVLNKHEKRLNCVGVTMTIIALHMISTHANNIVRDKKIKALEKEIEELKMKEE